MTNYEIFESYWKEACASTIYYLRGSRPIVTKDQLNDIWRRELLDNRFRSKKGITHGAKRFLDGLIISEPEVGNKILKLLMDSTFDIGTDENSIAAGAGISAASIIGGCAGRQKSRTRVKRENHLSIFAAALGVMAGAGIAGKSALDGRKNTVIRKFEKESAERLEVFKKVLE